VFEYDPEKSAANKIKHGIDFEEAQKLWADEVGVVAPVNSEKEKRFCLISRIEETYWTAIYTLRGDKIRIISVRKSRKNEKEIYRSGGI